MSIKVAMLALLNKYITLFMMITKEKIYLTYGLCFQC